LGIFARVREWTGSPYGGISKSTSNGCYTALFTTLKKSPTLEKAMPRGKDDRRYADMTSTKALFGMIAAFIFYTGMSIASSLDFIVQFQFL
jgi:hypothetical protein